VHNIRLSDRLLTANPEILAVPIGAATHPALAGTASATPGLLPVAAPVHADLRAQLDAYVVDSAHTGRSGALESLPRPTATPRRVLLVGVGDGDESGWRAAGAALVRAVRDVDAITVSLPPGANTHAIRGLAEGMWLASYTFNLTRRRPERIADPRPGRSGREAPAEAFVDTAPDEALRRVTLLVSDASEEAEAVLRDAATVATATRFARDLTNMPSQDKTPKWFADQVGQIAAGKGGLDVRVRHGDELDGFGGILAVGGGSTRGPRLVELAWSPPHATRHVVLVGKGITFDSGGICIKPVEGMKLMRKDMAGAAAIIAATFGAAEMDLPVRITALAPLAENMPSGSACRPGDVVHHYGGRTSEILNTDAEGRIVLADVLAYADQVLRPDVLIDLATLSGATAIALGKRTAALYTENDDLAAALCDAATAAGERTWRMPLHEDYLLDIRSDVADVANSSGSAAGSITAALFLREFTGDSRDRWVHLDMSAPSWADAADGELTRGATGWGVRTLLRWLQTVC
jgi:leucyl aminopeptidase